MAADLHIHVMDNVSEGDLACFFSHTLGSKWGPNLEAGLWPRNEDCKEPRSIPGEDQAYRADSTFGCGHHDRVMDAPSVWVGEVSWLKAALFEGGEEDYVPDVVGRVSEIIAEELPVIDDDLVGKITEAFDKAKAHGHYSTASRNEVLAFLAEHRNKRVFTVSW